MLNAKEEFMLNGNGASWLLDVKETAMASQRLSTAFTGWRAVDLVTTNSKSKSHPVRFR